MIYKENAGGNFLKKVPPCTPFKNFLTKGKENNSKDTDGQSVPKKSRIFASYCIKNAGE